MRFVSPETVRIDLKNDQWIEVKKELSAKERDDLSHAGLIASFATAGKKAPEPSFELDFAALNMAQVEAYLMDWSARSEDDKPVPVSPENIGDLATEDFDEIKAAIDTHVASVDAEKKDRAESATSTAPAS